jgi:hypothetical protein
VKSVSPSKPNQGHAIGDHHIRRFKRLFEPRIMLRYHDAVRIGHGDVPAGVPAGDPALHPFDHVVHLHCVYRHAENAEPATISV